MTENSKVRNLAAFLILCAAYIVPAIFISHDRMLDLVSLLMLVFAISAFWMIAGETWGAFWSGQRDRASLGLMGLFAVFLSVILMRTYGIMTRNVTAAEWLTDTHVYSAMVFLQFVGLWLFSRGATTPAVEGRRSRWGQMIVGIIIGALIASSKALEPILMFVSKLFSRIF